MNMMIGGISLEKEADSRKDVKYGKAINENLYSENSIR